MDPLYSLCNTLDIYKGSIEKTLDKINENLLQIVDTYRNTHDIEKKTKISQEILQALRYYVKILQTCEQLSNDILNISELDEKPNTNPFVHLSSKENDKIDFLNSTPLQIKSEENSDDLSSGSISINKANTLSGTGSPPVLDISGQIVERQSQRDSSLSFALERVFSPPRKDNRRGAPKSCKDSPNAGTSPARQETPVSISIKSEEIRPTDQNRKLYLPPVPERVDIKRKYIQSMGQNQKSYLPPVPERTRVAKNVSVEANIDTPSKIAKVDSKKDVNLQSSKVLNETENSASTNKTGKKYEVPNEKDDEVPPQNDFAIIKIKTEEPSEVQNQKSLALSPKIEKHEEISLLVEAGATTPIKTETKESSSDQSQKGAGAIKKTTSPNHDHKLTYDFGVIEPERSTKKALFPDGYKLGSAVEILMQRPLHDWREEVMERLEIKGLKKTLKWSKSPQKQKSVIWKNRERRILYNVGDSRLCVGEHCIICHIESPTEFYIRLDQKLFEQFDAIFNESSNEQHQYVVNRFKSKEEARVNLGNFCLGYLSAKRKWYRLEVIDWMDAEPESILVQLIDHGEKYIWSYNNIKYMSELPSLFTKMAIRCHLAGIYSPNPSKKTKWPQTAIDFFIETSEMRNMTNFTTIFVHQEGDSWAVDLRKASDPDAESLGELLVSNNHAFQIKILDIIPEDSEDEFDNINERISGYNATDEARICRFTDASGRCVKGASCRLEHSRLAEDGTTTDKVVTMREGIVILPLPEVKSMIKILITGYVSTCHFYGQIIEEKSTDDPFNEDFKHLSDLMNTPNLLQNYDKLKIFPGIGELVLVHHESTWYRGRCVKFIEKQDFEIFLVDFGFKITTDLKNLRQIHEDFLYVPFQAVECILSYCKEIANISTARSREFFDNAMKMKMFRAIVIESTLPLRLQMWDSDNLEMGHVVKRVGLGEDRDDSLCPVPNSILHFD